MFQKILIANRGEIAVRVIRACRDLGIATVAVYSEPDRGALHVRLADEAWPCGPARATESYLVISKLLEIARESGADAVHPGYGFLSENAALAEACAAEGIAFIGPSPDVIRAMGDKVTSRRLMSEAGVAVVPGSADAIPEDISDGDLLAAARALGLPVIVKASGGGGGRGMRIVRDEKDLVEAVARARSEAVASFGNDAVYFEKCLPGPRHIEVQVMADADGHVLHFFERECSIQRRHQKLLEEAPANIAPEQRTALCDAAVRATRAAGYVGAGTVEFLMDRDSNFYFLEMNTRIQVEHPVTEAITGIDLVCSMIRVAAGEPLGLAQEALQMRGHAIEARVYAEDPAKGFLPSPGRLQVFRLPAGPGVRIDEGVCEGDTVTPHYDSLLAKVTAWGDDRAQAIERLDRALAEFRVAGISTSIPFHRRMLAHDLFRHSADQRAGHDSGHYANHYASHYDTGFVDEHMDGGKSAAPEDEAATLRFAVALLAVAVAEHALPERQAEGTLRVSIARKGGGAGAAGPFLAEVVAWKAPLMVRVLVDGEPVEFEARCDDGASQTTPGRLWSVTHGGRQHEATIAIKRPGRFEVRIEADADTLAYTLELAEPD